MRGRQPWTPLRGLVSLPLSSFLLGSWPRLYKDRALPSLAEFAESGQTTSRDLQQHPKKKKKKKKTYFTYSNLTHHSTSRAQYEDQLSPKGSENQKRQRERRSLRKRKSLITETPEVQKDAGNTVFQPKESSRRTLHCADHHVSAGVFRSSGPKSRFKGRKERPHPEEDSSDESAVEDLEQQTIRSVLPK